MHHNLISALIDKNKCRKYKRRGQGRFNQLGGVYVNGRPLPAHLRHKIIELALEGTRPCIISRQLRVTHGCISKILNRYQESGAILPGCVISFCGSRAPLNSKTMENDPEILQQIYKRLKENPALKPYELRTGLIHDKFCTHRNAPSTAALKAIIREQNSLNQDNDNKIGILAHCDNQVGSSMVEPKVTIQDVNKEASQIEASAGSTDPEYSDMRRKSFCMFTNPHLNNMHHFLNGFGTYDQDINSGANYASPQPIELEANSISPRPVEQYHYTPKKIYRRRNASSAPPSDESGSSAADYGYLDGLDYRRRRGRTIFTALQLQAMEGAFDSAQYPDLQLRQTIARAFDMSEQRVSVWFSNRRARLRKVLERALKYGEGPRNEPIPTVISPNKNTPCQRSLNNLLTTYRTKFPAAAPKRIRVDCSQANLGLHQNHNSTGTEADLALNSLLKMCGQNSANGSAQGRSYNNNASGSSSDKAGQRALSSVELAYAYAERDEPEDYNFKYRPMQHDEGYGDGNGDGEKGRHVTPEDNSIESITLTSLLRGSTKVVQAPMTPPKPLMNVGRNTITPTLHSASASASASDHFEEVSPPSRHLNLEMGHIGTRSAPTHTLHYRQPPAGYGTMNADIGNCDSTELIPGQYCSAILRANEQGGPRTPPEENEARSPQAVGKHNGPPPPYYYPHQIQASGGLPPNQLYVASADGQLYMSGGAESFYEYNAMQAASYYGQMNNGASSAAMTADQYYYDHYYSAANYNHNYYNN